MDSYLKKCTEILSNPFLKISDIAYITQRSRSTVTRWITKSQLTKYDGFGYSTADVIRSLNLEEFCRSLKEQKM